MTTSTRSARAHHDQVVPRTLNRPDSNSTGLELDLSPAGPDLDGPDLTL